jgi:hypothetical protein
MISKNHQFPDPVGGPTKAYLNVRSSREYAEWVAALARTTRRSRQELVEYSLALFSEREGHPCGEPPERTFRAWHKISVANLAFRTLHCTYGRPI